MNAFMKFTEAPTNECKLSDLSKENPDKTLDYKELDKPINLSKTKGNEVSFRGWSNEDNYNYYMKAAMDHKFWAESHENSAKGQLDLAERNSDNPSKAESYINCAEKWQSKANSEWSAYKEDLDKANSYKE